MVVSRSSNMEEGTSSRENSAQVVDGLVNRYLKTGNVAWSYLLSQLYPFVLNDVRNGH
jgi:hypothetical protein